MRRLGIVLVLLLIAGAFAAGYWPQRERLGRAEAALAEARWQQAESLSRLESLEAQARLGRLFGSFLSLQDSVAAGKYGEAQGLSSAFFDRVLEEASQTKDASVRKALDAVLMRRDSVTAGLARSEASVQEVLVAIGRELRSSLGYPLPSLAPAVQVAAPAVQVAAPAVQVAGAKP